MAFFWTPKVLKFLPPPPIDHTEVPGPLKTFFTIEILDGYLEFGLDVLPKLSIRTVLIQLPHFRNARHNGLLDNFDYFAQQILKHQDSVLLY